MLCLSLLLPLAGSGLVAQGPPPTAPPAQPPAAADQKPDPNRQVIRRTLDIVTTDVIVRDNRGQFVADLNKDEFEVFEDGVKQDVQSFVLTHGGRVYNQTLPTPPKQQPGIILPPSRPTNAGRLSNTRSWTPPRRACART